MATVPTVTLGVIKAYGYQYYEKCGVEYIEGSELSGTSYAIPAFAVVQLVLFIVVVFLLKFQDDYMTKLSAMFTKPVSGSFYGHQENGREMNPVKSKLQYHIPRFHLALVSLASSCFQTASECYVVYQTYIGHGANNVYVLFPSFATAGAILGIFSILTFVFPDRKTLWYKFLAKTGLTDCYTQMRGWSGEGLVINYAIGTDAIAECGTAEQEFVEMVETQSLLQDNREQHDAEYIARHKSLVHGLGETVNEFDNRGRSQSVESVGSDFGLPRENDIVQGGLMSNPMFRQVSGRESLSLEDGPIPDILSPRGAAPP